VTVTAAILDAKPFRSGKGEPFGTILC
jgi:transposase